MIKSNNQDELNNTDVIRIWLNQCGLSTPMCEYCESNEAEGYVHAYSALVCVNCYEDHHGPLLE